MADRIVTGLTALGIALAPALLKFAEVSETTAVEIDDQAQVQCVTQADAPVHQRYQGTGDIEARLAGGAVVQVVSKRKNWRHIAYVSNDAAELGWITMAYLRSCEESSAAEGEDGPAPPPTATNTDESTLDSSPHVMLGIPTDKTPSDDFLIDHKIYVISYNRKRNDPNWVAWKLTAADLGDEDRQNDFRADDDLPSDFLHVTKADYAGTGFDRGHMCPSAHRTNTAQDNSLTFLMTNMQPQAHGLNAGPWKSMETLERGLADRQGKELYVVAGGLFPAHAKSIGHGINVPTKNFRITVVLDRGQGVVDVTKSTPIYAVEMPNDPSAAGHKWSEFQVTVDQVEKDSGYDFLPLLTDELEETVEATRFPPP